MSVYVDIHCARCNVFLFVYSMGGPLQGSCYCRECADAEQSEESK